jgi:hypothetical protein
VEDEPSEFILEVPSDLSATETDLSKIEGSFENQRLARQRNFKTHKKRDQKKRQQLRK